MFIAPSEPTALKAIGVSSSLPERHGVDIYWESKLGSIGIQRKQFPGDFLASVHDGRLYREYPMMEALDIKILIIEGREVWTASGSLLRDRGEKRHAWTRNHHENYLHSVQHLFGVRVHHTVNLADTVEYVQRLQVWADKDEHTSLLRRPGPTQRNGWGEAGNRAWESHLLQGVDGVGYKVAGAILDHFGGLPLRLTCTREELLRVPGIGPKLADKIVRTFDHGPTGL